VIENVDRVQGEMRRAAGDVAGFHGFG
jgi:hypothetical protein